jgi:hypothetical protein
MRLMSVASSPSPMMFDMRIEPTPRATERAAQVVGAVPHHIYR